MNAWTRPAARPCTSPSAYGRPETTTTTTGVPVARELVEQIGLHAGQSEVLGIAALAGRPVAEQAGEVADEGQAQVGCLSRGAGSGEAGPVLVLDLAAELMDDLDSGQLVAQRVEGARHLDSQPQVGMTGAGRGWERRSSP